MKKLIFLIIILFTLQSCYNDNEEDLYGPVLCDTADITYSEDVAPIINSSCATSGCHVAGGTGPGNFTVFSELLAKVNNGSFENRVLVQKTMPPGTALINCELDILQTWIDNGAPNN